MTTSILNDIKKALNLVEENTDFDIPIIMFINGIFPTLKQLGVGPDEGFAIEDDSATWDDFLGTDPLLNSTKSYVFLKARLIFDPPTTSYQIEAFNKMAQEFEWRLNVERESEIWTDPTIVVEV